MNQNTRLKGIPNDSIRSASAVTHRLKKLFAVNPETDPVDRDRPAAARGAEPGGGDIRVGDWMI